MKNEIVVEFNNDGYLLYSETFPGAYTRGASLKEALSKFPDEIKKYCMWASITEPYDVENLIVQEKHSNLKICDADSDVLFESEKKPLNFDEYNTLKELVLKSAEDFQKLYDSIPDRDATNLEERISFYGPIPRTSREMYNHTNFVTNYYVGELGVVIENLDNILENRIQALKAIESQPNYLDNQVFHGSYEEDWCLRKVLRRFIWHDRIHARAMYRMSKKIWKQESIIDPFFF